MESILGVVEMRRILKDCVIFLAIRHFPFAHENMLKSYAVRIIFIFRNGRIVNQVQLCRKFYALQQVQYTNWFHGNIFCNFVYHIIIAVVLMRP